jgi:putative Holliday junction resolvase
MRFLGVDYGRRRIGLALSDVAGLLARPWRTVEASMTPGQSATAVASVAAEFLRESDEPGFEAVVIGLPRRLNGEDTDQTAAVRQFAAGLTGSAIDAPVLFQDERLTSREAESQLATRERDWRARKKLIDAAAAAIILQDYLDGRARQGGRTIPDARS